LPVPPVVPPLPATGGARELPLPAPPTRRSPGRTVFVEVIRLCVVVLAASLTTRGTEYADERLGAGIEGISIALLSLGVAVGYVLGGVLGRFAMGRIDHLDARTRMLSPGELVATVIGGISGFVLGCSVTWPVLLFGGRSYTVPVAALVVAVSTAAGMRLGVARGGDLLRFMGASGRLPVSSPSSGAGARVVDTSALIDGRLLDVCRAGFLDGTLVVPRFILYELQGLADAEDPERRSRGRRGLDVLGGLQRSAGVAIEVADTDHPEIDSVDAKLVALARERGCALITVDGNLGRVAEVQGVRALNLHALAETLRPPVLPGDRLAVQITKPGREQGQGVGYLADGTMVVVEGGRSHHGSEVTAEVTSILSNPNGRMVFATAAPSRPVRAVAEA